MKTRLCRQIVQFWILVLGALAGAQSAHAVEVVPQIDPVSDAVGATPGEFSVDASGSANYSMPIYTAPAPGGVAPQIALTYSSRGGHGPLGVGFGISGTSSIERCRKTTEHGDGDGPHPAVSLTNADVYCLDGQRLIQLPSTSCPVVAGVAVSAEFRTEIDAHARICAYTGDSISTGPSRFTVERRDGSVAEYGFTGDSRVEPNTIADASNVVLRWALNRVKQPQGAYIDFVYDEDSAAGEHHLIKVNFTGNVSSPAVAPVASIEFVYEAMPLGSLGRRVDYMAGSKLTLSRRLTAIKSMADASTLVRSYQVCYEDNSNCFGDVNGAYSATALTQRLPRVVALRECANAVRNSTATSSCREPTKFHWNLPTIGYADAPASDYWSAFQVVDQRQGDFNGDGRSDLITLQNLTGIGRAQDGNGPVTIIPTIQYGTSTAINANGFVGYWYEEGTQPEMSGGTCTQVGGICTAAMTLPSAAGRYQVYDFTGDGLDDVLFATKSAGSSEKTVIYSPTIDANNHLQWGSGQSPLVDGGELGEIYDSKLSDIDGDGLPELLYRLTAPGDSDQPIAGLKLRRMVRNPGPGPVWAFGPEIAGGVEIHDASGFLSNNADFRMADSLPEVADVDGDGRVDFLMRVVARNSASATWHVLRSEGVVGSVLKLRAVLGSTPFPRTV